MKPWVNEPFNKEKSKVSASINFKDKLRMQCAKAKLPMAKARNPKQEKVPTVASLISLCLIKYFPPIETITDNT